MKRKIHGLLPSIDKSHCIIKMTDEKNSRKLAKLIELWEKHRPK